MLCLIIHAAPDSTNPIIYLPNKNEQNQEKESNDKWKYLPTKHTFAHFKRQHN